MWHRGLLTRFLQQTWSEMFPVNVRYFKVIYAEMLRWEVFFLLPNRCPEKEIYIFILLQRIENTWDDFLWLTATAIFAFKST